MALRPTRAPNARRERRRTSSRHEDGSSLPKLSSLRRFRHALAHRCSPIAMLIKPTDDDGPRHFHNRPAPRARCAFARPVHPSPLGAFLMLIPNGNSALPPFAQPAFQFTIYLTHFLLRQRFAVLSRYQLCRHLAGIAVVAYRIAYTAPRRGSPDGACSPRHSYSAPPAVLETLHLADQPLREQNRSLAS